MAVVILLCENVDNKNLLFHIHNSIVVSFGVPRGEFVTILFLMFINNYIYIYIVFKHCKYLLYYTDDLMNYIYEISDFSKKKKDKYIIQ